MKKRNILMCMEFLDIGGIETAVVTLCKGYARAGHNVYVAAKDGMFAAELKKIGVEILNIHYEINNDFRLDKKDELIKFCKEKNITEVHIHQYPCIMYWLPVCMELNLPYLAYAHSIVPGTIEWFTSCFTAYRVAIPIFLENATKIICIAESTKQEIENIYHLGEHKYKIIPNSLNLEDYQEKRKPQEISCFGIAARFAKEKVSSIKQGIDLFDKYSKNKKNCKLLIAGDGPEKEKIVSYIQKKKLTEKVELLGPVSNMREFYSNLDVFIGVDRCVLESLASKRITIISSYTGSMNLITKDNIELASKQNFSGMNLENDENVLAKLNKIDKKQYENIVDSNYKFVNRKFNVDYNLYRDKLEANYSKDYKYIYERINECNVEIYTVNNKLPIKIYRYVTNFIRKLIGR